MSWMGRLMHLFTPILAGIAIGALAAFFSAPSWSAGSILLFVVYLLPPLAFRIHDFFFPLRSGLSRLSDPKYSPWHGSHQIQLLYIGLPFLEALLRLVPGLYSAWLRLWGSQIGKGVYWTPLVEIVDRSLIEIGDHVVLGHRVCLISHVIDAKPDGTIILYVKKVRIGNRAFIGAGSAIGPGCTVEEATRIDAQTVLKVNERRSSSVS